FLFATEGAPTPACSGAMLSEHIAVTAKSCAKVGLIAGRAAVWSGKAWRASVTAVHVPPGKGAGIAVGALGREPHGVPPVLTHIPIRDNYSVNSFATESGRLPVISPGQGDAASIRGGMLSETATHSFIDPKDGKEICSGDVGAPVCSSNGLKLFGFTVFGTCG